jgi:hypothetical protein
LRTTLDCNEEKTHWTIYNTIREIKATFRILKTDLDLRPINHKSDEGAKAHLPPGHPRILAGQHCSPSIKTKKDNIKLARGG